MPPFSEPSSPALGGRPSSHRSPVGTPRLPCVLGSRGAPQRRQVYAVCASLSALGMTTEMLVNSGDELPGISSRRFLLCNPAGDARTAAAQRRRLVGKIVAAGMDHDRMPLDISHREM